METIIISLGFGSTAEQLANKGKSFAVSGTPAVMFDFRGASATGKSDGESTNLSVWTEVSDLNAVIEYVKECEWADDEQIFLLGESFGGLSSALTAAGREDIAGLILCFPALDKGESTRSAFQSKDEIPATIDMFGVTTGRKLWESLYDLDVFETISGYKGDVIIFHGTADSAVSYENSVRVNCLYEHSQIVLVEGAGHGFSGEDEKTVLKSVYAFMHKSNY